MKSVVGPESLMVTNSGFLLPHEVAPGTKVLGLGRTGKPELAAVNPARIEPQSSMTLFTTLGEVTLGTDSSVYMERGTGGKVGVLLERLKEDRYEGRNDVVAASPFLPSNLVFLRGETEWTGDLPQDDALPRLLGHLVRRVPEIADRIVIAVRRPLADEVKSDLEARCGHLLSGPGKELRTSEGRIWTWIRIEAPKVLAWLRKEWKDPRSIPRIIRSFGREDFLGFVDGALSVTEWSSDPPTFFTYLDEGVLRQLAGFGQALRNEGIEFRTEPVYQPMDSTFRIGGPLSSTAHVAAFCPVISPLFRIDFDTKMWAPVSGSIVLKPQ